MHAQGAESGHRRNVGFANVDGEDMEHLTSGLEDLGAGRERVVINGGPWEFGYEGDQGFVCALRGALGVVGLG